MIEKCFSFFKKIKLVIKIRIKKKNNVLHPPPFQLLFESLVNEGTASNRALCKSVAVSVHLLVLASFLWTSVMAWDIYKTFGRRAVITRVRSRYTASPEPQ